MMDAQEKLLAIECIRNLKARYFRFVDTKQWKELRSLFDDDATIFFLEAFDSPKPVDEAMTFIIDVLDKTVSIHSGYMPEIEIIDDRNARAIWPMQDQLYWSSAADNPFGISEMTGAGHYHETYRCNGGKWQIATLKLTRLRRATIPLPTACE
ncbi:nuclear transport factor 2 family protein [Noviherbaspirillum sedimenti]|uniref:Nuclear transport factor 2 family protein n=1 Tax=Noviherbaspirillum sedimenti TaxID=2320865 RepID=A0A3A3FYY6_9BURK|nr:nuclear transport factor 2 family protein [Noviherbaspirillum sedimenti]RJG01357.1 nuclear transport factor 2 family protein [Noviherbaspirillum sedimenti]